MKERHKFFFNERSRMDDYSFTDLIWALQVDKGKKNALWSERTGKWDIESITIPCAWERVCERASEQSGVQEQSKQCGAN